jgi:hypothetical protein
MVEGDLDGNGIDDIVFDFGSYGTYVFYNNSSWTKLHSLSPAFMATGDLDGEGYDDVIAVFEGYGTYVYYNNSVWTKLHSLSPTLITTGDMDGGGQDELIAVFGGHGLYVYYNNTSWSKLHGLVPELVGVTTDLYGDMDETEDIIVDFGPAYGIYVYYNNSAWTKLHALSPTFMLRGGADISGGAVLGFNGYGLYAYNGWEDTWLKLHDIIPETGILADIAGDSVSEFIADFGSYGIYALDPVSWTWSKLHGLSPDNDAGMVAINLTSSNLTGSWSGNWQSSTGIGGNLTADLIQNDDVLSGVVSITGSACISSGTVSGIVSNDTVTFGVVSGFTTVEYTASFISDAMSGTYSVTSGACAGDTGSFWMIR